MAVVMSMSPLMLLIDAVDDDNGVAAVVFHGAWIWFHDNDKVVDGFVVGVVAAAPDVDADAAVDLQVASLFNDDSHGL